MIQRQPTDFRTYVILVLIELGDFPRLFASINGYVNVGLRVICYRDLLPKFVQGAIIQYVLQLPLKHLLSGLPALQRRRQ
jgi:hypothetical protein